MSRRTDTPEAVRNLSGDIFSLAGNDFECFHAIPAPSFSETWWDGVDSGTGIHTHMSYPSSAPQSSEVGPVEMARSK